MADDVVDAVACDVVDAVVDIVADAVADVDVAVVAAVVGLGNRRKVRQQQPGENWHAVVLAAAAVEAEYPLETH